MTRLIDVELADLIIPPDPHGLPDTGVDAGVLPRDMADHLRAAKVFPVAPTVRGPRLPMPVIGGGRCVWAAAQAGWDRPIQCVLLGATPPGFTTTALGDAPRNGPAQLVHSASFEGELSAAMRQEVIARMRQLAARMARAGLKGFSRVDDFRWPRPDLLHLSAPSGAGNVPVLGRELWALFDGLASDGIVLRAWDGRRFL
ncbi:hypothetical protein ABT174_21355 [Streptomyces sparsogenes]|uniref:hypothetical protein n=1 Tax=Streptomyces sparsogenes TaxID=67365 RepID=UPI003318C1B8